MWDAILDYGTVFDWISPVIAFIQDLLYGPSAAFLVPEDAGWSGREIQKLLSDHGIKVWGLMIVSNTIMFNVRQAQARWAEYLLLRAGVPFEGGLPHSTRYKRSRTATNEHKKADLFGNIEGALRKLDDFLDL